MLWETGNEVIDYCHSKKIVIKLQGLNKLFIEYKLVLFNIWYVKDMVCKASHYVSIFQYSDSRYLLYFEGLNSKHMYVEGVRG